MPWWSWVVIWVVLVLGMLGMLVAFAFALFHKLMAAFDALGELTAKADLLGDASEAVADPPFHSAAFDEVSPYAEEWSRRRHERALKRQSRREARIRRATILVKADPRRFSHLLRRT